MPYPVARSCSRRPGIKLDRKLPSLQRRNGTCRSNDRILYVAAQFVLGGACAYVSKRFCAFLGLFYLPSTASPVDSVGLLRPLYGIVPESALNDRGGSSRGSRVSLDGVIRYLHV